VEVEHILDSKKIRIAKLVEIKKFAMLLTADKFKEHFGLSHEKQNSEFGVEFIKTMYSTLKEEDQLT